MFILCFCVPGMNDGAYGFPQNKLFTWHKIERHNMYFNFSMYCSHNLKLSEKGKSAVKYATDKEHRMQYMKLPISNISVIIVKTIVNYCYKKKHPHSSWLSISFLVWVIIKVSSTSQAVWALARQRGKKPLVGLINLWQASSVMPDQASSIAQRRRTWM